jgi:transposase
MTEEEALQLRKENQELREALNQTQELLRLALARIEELEKQKTPPAFVKADVKKPAPEEKQPRKKRASQHNQARRRSLPTQIVEHHVAICP